MLGRHAFTLVETLVAIAIVTVLAGFVFPALVRAKERSKRSVDLSNLRQIGQAQAIYEVDRGETHSIEALVSAGVLSRSIVASPRDPVLGGRVNAIMAFDYRRRARTQPPPKYEIGYLSTGDFGPNLEKAIPPECDHAPRRGWVIDLAEVGFLQKRPALNIGVYDRLLKDGAVVRARTGLRAVAGGTGFRSQDFFMDVQEPCASAPLRP